MIKNQKKRLIRKRKKTCKIGIGTLQTCVAFQLLNRPVNGTIFFAGEGLFENVSPGTVEQH